MSLTVRVIAPDKVVWDGEVEEVILPSTTGQMGILSNHAPLLTALDTGVMRVRPGKDWQNIAIMGGFAEVEDNQVQVLVNEAQLGSEIDKNTARQAFTEAQSKANAAAEGADKLTANKALKKARACLQAAGEPI